MLGRGRTLGVALAEAPPLAAGAPVDERDVALRRELCTGALRWHWRLRAIVDQLLSRDLPERELEVRCLLHLGVYQLLHLRIPAHAAVSATVGAARLLGKPWASGLVNACLRRLQRERDAILAAADAEPQARLAHPAWLLCALAAAWPEDHARIVAAGNAHPPMHLRVNRRLTDPDTYLARLREVGLDGSTLPHADAGIALATPVPVERLPGFDAGEVSVQDGAAQLAAPLLAPAPGMRVLDACAAPGGKAAHLLERYPEIGALTAVEIDPTRAESIRATIARLGLAAEVVVGDATDPGSWWDGRPFDRILLDAPCSATGVIRRNPDIKVLRRPEDVDALAALQRRLLDALWPLLAADGRLLYATCSVLPRENDRVIESFLADRHDAVGRSMAATWGRPTRFGRQVLPGDDGPNGDHGSGMDGFYYALLARR